MAVAPRVHAYQHHHHHCAAPAPPPHFGSPSLPLFHHPQIRADHRCRSSSTAKPEAHHWPRRRRRFPASSRGSRAGRPRANDGTCAHGLEASAVAPSPPRSTSALSPLSFSLLACTTTGAGRQGHDLDPVLHGMARHDIGPRAWVGPSAQPVGWHDTAWRVVVSGLARHKNHRSMLGPC